MMDLAKMLDILKRKCMGIIEEQAAEGKEPQNRSDMVLKAIFAVNGLEENPVTTLQVIQRLSEQVEKEYPEWDIIATQSLESEELPDNEFERVHLLGEKYPEDSKIGRTKMMLVSSIHQVQGPSLLDTRIISELNFQMGPSEEGR